MTPSVKEYRYDRVDDAMRERYKDIFALTGPLPDRWMKVLFDKVLALILLLFLLPLLALVAVLYLVDIMFCPEDRGPLFSGYWGGSRGRKFMKYKFRSVKNSLIDKEKEKAGHVDAYPSGNRENLTRMGWFLKKYYLDEIPQICSVLSGYMSFVGPRALAWEHAWEERNVGNVTVDLLKAGIFSPTHVRKGTPDIHNIALEFDYVEKYMRLPSFALLLEDIRIILLGIKVVAEGGGY